MKNPIVQMAKVFLSNVFKKEIDRKIDEGFEGFLTKILSRMSGRRNWYNKNFFGRLMR
jgi:hypothetical protein